MEQLEFSDIQGILISAYSDLHCASYLMCEVTDGMAARAWLQRIAPRIKDAEKADKASSINIAFTVEGLRKFGIDSEALATFSFAFQEGMTPEYRSRILGDVGENHPKNWFWGGYDTRPIDLMLMVFTCDEPTLTLLVNQIQANFSSGGLALAMNLRAGRQPDNKEHFGFMDGVGQPVIEGSGNKTRQLNRTGHATELKPGEFILGYINEYGLPAESPVVRHDPRQILCTNGSGQPDLGRNGSYLVFRHMEQHVARFWNYLDSISRGANGQSNPVAREMLAAKFVGRWTSGAPLVLAPQQDDPKLSSANDFDYRHHDPYGLKCPIGAHIRRANPRDSLGSDQNEAIESSRRHRLLRRGRSYGRRQADPLTDDGQERGLFFVALNADLERQFEFVQQTWINGPSLGGLDGEVDPLVGIRGTGMTIQAEPVRLRCHNLPSFVTVRGGGYFFLPGLRALNYLATLE